MTDRLAPDALGPAARAQIVAGSLGDLQEQEFRLDLLQLTNGAADGDPYPTREPPPEGATPQTYGERRAALRGAQEKIVEAYPEVMPEVERTLASAAEAQEAARLAMSAREGAPNGKGPRAGRPKGRARGGAR